MAGELRNYLASIVTTAGVTRAFGSLVSPYQDSSIDGDVLDDATHTVPDSDDSAVTLWTYSAAKPDFTQIILFPDGPIDIQIKYDKPTSTTNASPATTHVNYAVVRVRAHTPHIIGSQDALVVANGATINTAILGATVAEGRVYEITARKPAASDDDDVTVRAVVIN